MATTLKATLHRADVSWALTFARPLLKELGHRDGLIETVSLLHKRLSEPYGLALDKIRIPHVNSPGDFAIKIALFGALGTIDLKFDGYTVEFKGLTGPDDTKVAVECLRTVEGIIKEIAPDVGSKLSFSLAAWYVCEGGPEAVKALFSEHASPRLQLEAGFLEASDIDTGVRGALRNGEELWGFSFYAENSAINGADIFFRCDAAYLAGGRYSSLAERAEHSAKMAYEVLSRVGVKVEEKK